MLRRWEAGTKLMTEQATLFFKAFKAAGGPIDELVSDWEQHDWGMFGFESGREDDEPCPSSPANATAACRVCLDAKLRAIQNDKRFSKLLPELMSFGFEANVSEPDYLVKAMRQYQCVQGQPCAAGPQGPADRNKLAWTTFVQKRASAALVTAVETPMRAFYPKARLSAYWQKVWDPAHCFTPESEGYMQCRGGPLDGGAAGAVALSIQSPVYYIDAFMCAFDCGDSDPFNKPSGGYPGACNPDACDTAAGGVARALKQFQGVPSFPLNHFNMAKYVVNHVN